MTTDPIYREIGNNFVRDYYVLFDDPAQRPNLEVLYNVSDKIVFFLMSF